MRISYSGLYRDGRSIPTLSWVTTLTHHLCFACSLFRDQRRASKARLDAPCR